MDRIHKVKELVLVFETSRAGPELDRFHQQPYSCYGYDNYIYKGKMYKGFAFGGQDYILLSEPLF